MTSHTGASTYYGAVGYWYLRIVQSVHGSKWAKRGCAFFKKLTRPRGSQESPTKTALPEYDEKVSGDPTMFGTWTATHPSQCYLCPGNTRANGEHNPKFEDTYVFVNDYSAVMEEQQDYCPHNKDGSLTSRLFRAEAVTGKCYVICFSPSHNLTLADMTPRQILPIIETWTSIYCAHLDPNSPLAELAVATQKPRTSQGVLSSSRAQYRYMQIFENMGSAMGCSNPHPHGQVWTTTSLPEEPATELIQLSKYRREHEGSHMLTDYTQVESKEKIRTVFENESFWAGVPYWAVWPFEIMIIPRKHKRSLVDFTKDEQAQLAECIAEVTRRYDNLFETQFPYSELFTIPISRCKKLNIYRHGRSPSPSSWIPRRNRVQPLPHPLLSTASPKCHDPQVSSRLRNASRTAT